MAAPAAPRKRGALTSSTAPRRPRADGAVTAPAVAASRRVASATEVDLVRRLEQVNLDKTATSCRPAASTSRLQTRSGTISKAAPGTTKAAPVSRTGSPPATVDSLLGSINNTLRKLGKTRKAASQPTSASKVLVDEVKTSFPRLQASLANLRKLATSGDDAGQPPTPSRLLSIERAAIMLVSHCIEAGLHELAIQELANIRQALISLYQPDPSAETNITERLQQLNLDATQRSIRASSRGTASTASSVRRSTTSTSSIKDASNKVQESAALLIFPSLPAQWSTSLSVQEVCISVLIVQNQILGCLFGMCMSIQLRSTAPRIPTPSSTTSRRTATGVDQAPAELEHNCRTILESLQAEDGGPLAFFKNAGTQLKADERIKVEHYVSTIYSLLMKQTSELASSCTISPSTTLSLQFYALECLLENKTYFALSTTEQEASSDNDKPVQSLASSLHRAVVSFGKSSTANASSESEIALQLSTKLSPLLTHIDEVIKPKDRLRKCQTFLEVIDLLVQLYGRGQLDPQPLQAMITEVRSTRHTIPEGPDDAESKNSIAWERDAIALCSRLSTHVTNLERWISSSFAFKQFDPTLTQQCMMQAGDALAYSGSIAECPENKSSDKIRQNLVRSLERSHHYAYRAYKAIQKDDSTSTMLKNPASSVLKDLLGSFCEIATSSKVTSGILARAIDTWLLFAHKDLDASNSATFRIVYAHVKQAESTLNQMGLDSDRALSQRTLASSTYTIGRSLYNAERYANAIPFLKMSCILTDTIDSVTQDSNSREIHGDTADRAPGRWELLGSAYAQCKEMDDALNAYVKSLRGFFARLTHPSGQKASIDPDFQRVLAKYTRLSIVDKLLEPSEAAAVVVLADMDLDPMTRGYLLESQASCLQDYLHKSEAANAASYWLSEAETTFVQCQAGPELARVLFRSMHLAVSRPRDGASTCRAAELGARIISVCSAQESLSWATQYAALARLLLIINSVKRQDPTASKQMAKHAKEALSAFRSTLSFSNSISSPQGQSADRESARQTAHLQNKKPAPLTSKLEKAHRTLETTVSTRKPLSPRRAASSSANRIVTPPRQKEKSPETPVKTQVLRTTFSQLQMPRETVSLLSTVASLLGLFEHTFLRLGYLRLLKNIYDSCSPEDFIDICLELAAEYRKLGKLSRAHTMLVHAEYTATTCDLSVEARTMLLLRKAEHLAYNDDPSTGLEAYRLALASSENILVEENPSSPRHRIISRTNVLYRSAIAAEVFSVVIEGQGKPFEALASNLQALRLCNRALFNLARLSPVGATAAAVPDEEHPAAATSFASRVSTAQVKTRALASRVTAGDALAWKLYQSLTQSLTRIARLYECRGSVKLATYFYSQAAEFASALGAPRSKAKILAKQLDLSSRLQCDTELEPLLEQLTAIASTEGGLSSIDLLEIRAYAATKQGDPEEAERALGLALKSLNKLDKAFGDTELQFISPPRPRTSYTINQFLPPKPSSTLTECIVPDMLRRILRSYILLLNDRGHSDQTRRLLEKLISSSQSSDTHAENAILDAKLRLSSTFLDIRQDPIAGLLSESVLSVPVLSKVGEESPSETKLVIPAQLSEIELLLIGAATQYQPHANPPQWKDVTKAIAHIQILRTNMSWRDASSAQNVVSALEAGLAVTARREMLEVLHSKLTNGILKDDLLWPKSQPRLTVSKPLSNYWLDLEDRYLRSTASGSLSSSGLAETLPSNWSVLSLHTTPGRDSLVAVRYECGQTPTVLQLPLDRAARRDGEDQLFDLDAAQRELREIIQSANQTSQNAKNVISVEQRREWWTERKALDRRLAALLVNIQDRWLGAYKNFLVRPRIAITNRDYGSKRHAQLSALIEKSLLSSRANKTGDLCLAPVIVDIFHSLSNDATDGDIEDWLHFVVDSLQFAGAEIACDEIDLDQTVVDLKTILEERKTEAAHDRGEERTGDEHLFLVLDQGLHSFPWESLPCFDGLAISRLPSVEFLRDRLLLKKHLQDGTAYAGLEINPSRVSYVINPDGDLKHTQKEFGSLLQSREWQGVSERVPMEEEMRKYLSGSDVFLYFGHGGAEQYLRLHVLQALSSCATVFLWGCSSSYLKEQGEFEEAGTPISYMQAGAPAVVGNLWDVTDKDLDRYTHSALESFGLFGECSSVVPLPQAIASSRSACALRYLNGAAPVMWGLPVKVGR